MIEDKFLSEVDAVLKKKFNNNSFEIMDYCEAHRDNPVIAKYLEVIESIVDKELNL